MKYICDTCEKYPCSADEAKLMLSCPAYSPKPKPITNADRIRCMTDEDLATWIDRIQADAYEHGMMETPVTDYPNIYSGWLDWLKEEALP